MNSLRSGFSQVLSLSLSDSCSLSVEPCSQTQINGRNTSTWAFNSRPWKTGSVFKTSVHLYPPDLRTESVLPRESSARGGRRRETLRLNSQQAVQISHAQNALCHMNGARDFWSLQSCRFSHGARRVTQQMAVRDMLIVQCALQLLPKARSLTTYFLIFQFQMTVSGWLLLFCTEDCTSINMHTQTNNDIKERKKRQRLFTPSEGGLVFGQSVTSNK